MDDDTTYSIGELAGRTGLTVKAIRYYSDLGIVPPSGRTPAGYRRYGADEVVRLDLVRTLRELGLDLATIRKVVDRDLSLSEVASAHAEALAAQIRVLRLRRAVLLTVADHGPPHRLATLSAAERDRLIDDWLRSWSGSSGHDECVRSSPNQHCPRPAGREATPRAGMTSAPGIAMPGAEAGRVTSCSPRRTGHDRAGSCSTPR